MDQILRLTIIAQSTTKWSLVKGGGEMINQLEEGVSKIANNKRLSMAEKCRYLTITTVFDSFGGLHMLAEGSE